MRGLPFANCNLFRIFASLAEGDREVVEQEEQGGSAKSQAACQQARQTQPVHSAGLD
jgi:hypothetical protein